MLNKISIVWLFLAGLVAAISLGADVFKIDLRQWLDPITVESLKIYCLFTVVMSPIAFVQFGWDKRQAKNDGWRVPEKTLLGSAAACGWPGAVLGQAYFRHKTTKQPFERILGGITFIHLLLPIGFIFARLAGFI